MAFSEFGECLPAIGWLALVGLALIPMVKRDLEEGRILPEDRWILLIPAVCRWSREPAEFSAGLAAGGAALLAGWMMHRCMKGRLLGGGDLKTLAAAGVLLGADGLLQTVLVSLCLALASAARRGLSPDSRVFLGPYLAGGIWLSALAEVVKKYL